MENNYTEYMESKIYDLTSDYDENADKDINTMITFMKENQFMLFGERLKRFIRTLSADETIDCEKYLKEHAQMNSVKIFDDRTIERWLNLKNTPKREKAFLIVFALGLSLEDTINFFEKVYFDRAFDVKNTDEMVYYYCIKNNKKYDKALELIARINVDDLEDESSEKKTMHTKKIQDKIDVIIDEDSFIRYARLYNSARKKENCTGQEVFKNLKEIAKINIQREDETDESIHTFKYFYIDKNGEKKEKIDDFNDAYKNDEKDSPAHMYKRILGINLVDKKTSGTKSPFAGGIINDFPKELFHCFTDLATMGKIMRNKEESYEKNRKAIILFNFYNWASQESPSCFDEDCNYLLEECGYPKLYYGNPFDWLFLYCSLANNPLDAFREFVYRVIENDTED